MGRADLVNTRGGVKRAEAGHNAPAIDAAPGLRSSPLPRRRPLRHPSQRPRETTTPPPWRSPRANRGNTGFLRGRLSSRAGFVALLCERAATRFAKALSLHFAFVRKIGESGDSMERRGRIDFASRRNAPSPEVPPQFCLH
jgi:hypothetical protein